MSSWLWQGKLLFSFFIIRTLISQIHHTSSGWACKAEHGGGINRRWINGPPGIAPAHPFQVSVGVRRVHWRHGRRNINARRNIDASRRWNGDLMEARHWTRSGGRHARLRESDKLLQITNEAPGVGTRPRWALTAWWEMSRDQIRPVNHFPPPDLPTGGNVKCKRCPRINNGVLTSRKSISVPSWLLPACPDRAQVRGENERSA